VISILAQFIWTGVLAAAPQLSASSNNIENTTVRSSKESVPVILSIFPPPDAPRTKNTSEVGIELAFAENLEWQGKLKLVHITGGKKYTFRVCFYDNIQAAKLADFVFMNEKSRRVIVFMNRKETFSMGVSEIFKIRFEALGGKVLETISF